MLLAFGIYYVISKGVDKRLLPTAIPFAIISSIFVLLSSSYYKYNSWEQVFGSTCALWTSVLKGAGIAALFFLLYLLVNRLNITTLSSPQLKTTPFKTWLKITVIFALCWLPYVIIMMPGSMNSDVKEQLAQILNNPDYCWTAKAVAREEGSSLLNNYHPLFHSALLALFLKIGGLLGSYNIGFTLMCFTQSAAIAGSVSLGLVYLRKHTGITDKLYKGMIIFFAVNPLLPLWSTTLTKDPLFIIALLLVTVMLYDCFKNPENFGVKKFIALAAVLFFTMISRNNGFYLVLGLLPFAIIHFRKDRRFLLKVCSVLIIPILLFKVGYTGILFSAADIQETSPREMLSIPFQQTARYIVEYGDEITPDEEEAILKVLSGSNGDASLEKIADRYTPYISDNVKSLYNINADTDDLINYFKVWANELIKHPDSYFQAFFNMTYSWFCFDSSKDNIYYNMIEKQVTEMIEEIKRPESLSPARNAILGVVMILDKLPLTAMIFEFSAYTWGYVIIFLVLLRRKKYTELLAFLPIFFNYAICFVGPVAYMRYAIPMVACFPFVFIITFAKSKAGGDEHNPGDGEIKNIPGKKHE